MISKTLSNRLIFILSLLGLGVSAFLFYEYSFSDSIVCPTGRGCDIVRVSPYSSFLGISIPILGIIFYFSMAVSSVLRSYKNLEKIILKLQLLAALAGVGFGVYLTYLEAFVINAFCFWCVLSFIISILILLAVFLTRKELDNKYEN